MGFHVTIHVDYYKLVTSMRTKLCVCVCAYIYIVCVHVCIWTICHNTCTLPHALCEDGVYCFADRPGVGGASPETTSPLPSPPPSVRTDPCNTTDTQQEPQPTDTQHSHADHEPSVDKDAVSVGESNRAVLLSSKEVDRHLHAKSSSKEAGGGEGDGSWSDGAAGVQEAGEEEVGSPEPREEDRVPQQLLSDTSSEDLHIETEVHVYTDCTCKLLSNIRVCVHTVYTLYINACSSCKAQTMYVYEGLEV